MEVNKSFNSESPSSTYTERSRTTSISSARYQTADEGSENESDNASFCDLESDVLNQQRYTIPPAPRRRHVADNTETTPLLIDYTSFKQAVDAPSKWMVVKESLKKTKPYFLFLWCIVFAGFFVSSQENQHTEKLVCVSNQLEQDFKILEHSKIVRVTVKGPFSEKDDENSTNFLSVGLEMPSEYETSKEDNKLAVLVNSSQGERDSTPVSKTMSFKVPSGNTSGMSLRLKLYSGENYSVAVSITHSSETITENLQIVLAFLILIAVYILIIFELVHRATAAMLGGLGALSILSYLNKRPTLDVVLMWIEWETLSLLFGMMILVAVFAQTGFFDYIALKAYKISKGRIWSLITLLCIFTGVISAFLDNVTTILLLTPVTIRLCQVLNLDPTNVLIAEVIFSNIGGTATAIGDPPNVLLVSHKDILNANINFSDFTKHLLPGIVVCFIVGYAGLRLLYLCVQLENSDSPEIAELKREVEIWRRTADRVPHVSPEEKTVKLLLIQKMLRLETTIRNMERRQTREQVFQQNVRELENKYKITDFPLLAKSGFVITVVVVLFFLQSFVTMDFAIGWIAVIGAMALILLAHIENIEELMEKVEWTTLVFFAGLFVLMEGLKELGLFDFLSEATCSAIQKVDESNRLAVAIVAIIWISALASSFVDNIPFTTAMIPITIKLHSSDTAVLPLEPLVWALAMGACLGGNGTLIGASANVVCAGLAEQYGYPISFMKFTKIGFPMMLITVTVAMGYLLVCHVAYDWHH